MEDISLDKKQLELLKKNGVDHRVATLYRPQTNGFILKFSQQEEALHHIQYALKRCKILGHTREISLFECDVDEREAPMRREKKVE
ncbi:unnamed protein product [Spirodela intermedia]|uniref:Uncharacterized protein n=1 Tax=Spirodela intermedia TaxID=51605 RepID=A0A7I8L701_SPIIN|nr:unnamed protein product [Spirodela intermedia]